MPSDHRVEHSHVYAILQGIGWPADSASISPLGGLTNQNYRIDLPTGSFALRLGGKGTDLLGINRERELIATRTAAALGIGPEVVFADARQDILITRLIQGTSLSPGSLSQPEVMARIVAALKCCHQGPAIPDVFSVFATIRQYAQLAQQRGVTMPETAHWALSALETLAEVLDPPAQWVPCHNDLLAGNFLDSAEGLRIIDWEYAAMGDAFFDLGNFAANHELSAASRLQLLQLYLGEFGAAESARLELMQAVSNLREAFWGYVQAGISQLEIDYLAYAQTYLDRFLQAESDFNKLLNQINPTT